MKKTTHICLSLLTMFVISCNTEDDIETPTEELVTYTKNISSIMQGKCIGCHDETPINGAPMPLISLEQVKEAIENRNLILRIEDGSMPPGTIELSNKEIQAIKDWAVNNFPR